MTNPEQQQRKIASAKGLRGLGAGLLISSAVISLSNEGKVKGTPYLLAFGGIAMFASLFFEE